MGFRGIGPATSTMDHGLTSIVLPDSISKGDGKSNLLVIIGPPNFVPKAGAQNTGPIGISFLMLDKKLFCQRIQRIQ